MAVPKVTETIHLVVGINGYWVLQRRIRRKPSRLINFCWPAIRSGFDEVRPLRTCPASKTDSSGFSENKLSDRCNDIWNCVKPELKERYGCIVTSGGRSKQDVVSVSQAFYISWTSMAASEVCAEFLTMFRFPLVVFNVANHCMELQLYL